MPPFFRGGSGLPVWFLYLLWFPLPVPPVVVVFVNLESGSSFSVPVTVSSIPSPFPFLCFFFSWRMFGVCLALRLSSSSFCFLLFFSVVSSLCLPMSVLLWAVLIPVGLLLFLYFPSSVLFLPYVISIPLYIVPASYISHLLNCHVG